MTRVFLIASAGRERERLEDLLEAAGAEVVGSASDLESATDELRELAEVVVIGASAEPLVDLLEALPAQGLDRESRVVLLTNGSLPAPVWTNPAMRAGVRGILAGDVNAAQLGAALDAVAEGLVVLSAGGRPYQSGAADGSGEPDEFLEPLTAREREVLRMLAEGRGNKEIAGRMNISEHTVKFHVGSILGKLGASTRTEAVSVALRRGLILL